MNTGSKKPMTRQEEADLAALAQGGDIEARNRLVEHNLGLVYRIALHFSGGRRIDDDFVQAGTLGLIRAIEKFDATKGVRLIGYAKRWIATEIMKEIQDKVSAVWIPVHARGYGKGKWKTYVAPSMVSIDAGTPRSDDGLERAFDTIADQHDHIAEADERDQLQADMSKVRDAMMSMEPWESRAIGAEYGIDGQSPVGKKERMAMYYESHHLGLEEIRMNAMAKLREAMQVRGSSPSKSKPHGADAQAGRRRHYRLTPECVRTIRILRAAGMSYYKIGNVIGYSADSVRDVVTGKTHRHIA